jgi:hypothetical protein
MHTPHRTISNWAVAHHAITVRAMLFRAEACIRGHAMLACVREITECKLTFPLVVGNAGNRCESQAQFSIHIHSGAK